MNRTIKYTTVFFLLYGLSSCAVMEDSDPNYRSYSVDETVYYPAGSPRYMMQGNTMQPNAMANQQGGNQAAAAPSGPVQQTVVLPGAHKSMDRNWVNSQNPMGYTIELGDDAKAAVVAGKLNQAPKTDRMAQVKYNKNGQSQYMGLYGSYESEEAAKKAYDQLPASVKQGASVKSWSTVQGKVNY